MIAKTFLNNFPFLNLNQSLPYVINQSVTTIMTNHMIWWCNQLYTLHIWNLWQVEWRGWLGSVNWSDCHLSFVYFSFHYIYIVFSSNFYIVFINKQKFLKYSHFRFFKKAFWLWFIFFYKIIYSLFWSTSKI